MRLPHLAFVVFSLGTLGANALDGGATVRAPPRLTERPLVDPPLLRNVSHQLGTVEVMLTASPTRLALAPGKVTEAYAFSGSVPGPTLEVYEGDRHVAMLATQDVTTAMDKAFAANGL